MMLRGLCAAGFVALLSTAACDQPLTPEAGPSGPLFADTYGSTLVECPSNESESATGTLDVRGGSIALGRHRLNVPALALLKSTHFELTDPVTNYVILDLKANGKDAFEFRRTAEITIDYSRCTRSNIEKGPLTVWKIDPVTHTLLEPMGGTDDKVARTLTFSTDGLSTYAIAN